MNLSIWERLIRLLERENFQEDDTLSDRIVQARTYVDARLYRADVVSVLPATAPAGYLMVKAGDANIYIGTGPGPLRKIPTQAL